MAGTPRRILVLDQLVALLREGILGGRWKGELPGETELCREFQVGRNTLRKGLSQLAVEGWIELGGRGRFHRILRVSAGHPVPNARTIRMLTPFAIARWGATELDLLDAFQEKVRDAGYRVAIEHHPGIFETFQAGKLARLDALPDTAGWILMWAREPILRWFAAQSRPTVVLGKVEDHLPLSSIHPDYEAVARHAAGLLHGKGHRAIVYLRAEVTSIGDRVCSEIFVSEVQRLGAQARCVIHDASAESVRRVMLDVLASRPPTTAWFVGSSEIAVTALCHLLAAGVRVPAEASVISAWDAHHLDMTHPAIARYRTDGKLIGRRAGEAMLDLVLHGTGKVLNLKVLPDFVAGGSVGPGR